MDDSVWMVKTHYPERMGYLKFKARRIVLLVRNPFDAIESYFHMGMTNTHDKHLSPQVIFSRVSALVFTHVELLKLLDIILLDGSLSDV